MIEWISEQWEYVMLNVIALCSTGKILFANGNTGQQTESVKLGLRNT